MTFITQRTKLIDCLDHGKGSELFVVEGDSASKSVAKIRDANCQAVLPMQGKPMNAVKSSESAVRNNQWYAALIESLGVGWPPCDFDAMRYDRVTLLFDPDADGIHCGALMLMFFDKYLGPLIDARRVSLVNPPLYRIRVPEYNEFLNAYSDEHLFRIRKALSEKDLDFTQQKYRGLASIPDDVLLETCVRPETRTAYLVRREDAAAARNVFGSVAR